MFRKTCCLFLALLMVVSLLGACTKTDPDSSATSTGSTSTGSPSTGSPSTGSPSTEPSSSEPVYGPNGELMSDIPNMTAAGVFPIVTEPVTLTIALPAAPNVSDFYDNYFTHYIEEKTGIHLEFELYPNDTTERNQKFDLDVAADALTADIYMRFPIGLVKAQEYGQAGYIEDLTEYFNKYEYYFNEAHPSDMSQARYVYDLATKYTTSPDGGRYFFPVVSAGVIDDYCGYIALNKTWLNNLGLQYPKTSEELYNVLKAFKTQDPNRNGIQDEMPLVFGTNTNFYDYKPLLNMFTYISYSGFNVLDNDTIVRQETTEGYREGLRYIRRLVSEDLIPAICLTTTKEELRVYSEPAEGEDIIVGGLMDFTMFYFDVNGPLIFEYMIGDDVLKGPSGTGYASYRTPFADALIFINAKSPNKEIAFRFLDAIYEQEASVSARWAEKGVDWVVVTDDPNAETIFPLGLPAYWRNINNYWGAAEHNKFWQEPGQFYPPTYAWTRAKVPMADPNNPTGTEYNNWEINYKSLKNNIGKQPDKICPNLIYNESEDEVMGRLGGLISECCRTYTLQFLLGEKSLDSDWDAFINELNARGYQEYIAAANSAYDRMK